MTVSNRPHNPPPSPFAPGDPAPEDTPPPPPGWFEGLALCIISKAFYLDVLYRWRGVGILYLAVMLALLSIPAAMKTHQEVGDQFRQRLEEMGPQLPNVTVADNRVSVDKPVPLTITHSDASLGGAPYAFVDTSGNFQDLHTRKELLVVTDRAVFFNLGKEGQYYELPPICAVWVDAKSFTRSSNLIIALAGWMFYPILWLRDFCFWGFHSLMLAALSTVMMVGPRLKVKFGDMLRLCVVACTPAMYLNLVAILVGIRWDLWTMVLAMVIVIYVTGALRSAAEQAIREEQDTRGGGDI